jgi:hypothetical protein
VVFGHRDQLDRIQAVAGAFADQGGGGALVAVPGGGRDRQPQPIPTGQGPRWLGCLAVGLDAAVVGGWLHRQMPPQARQGALGGYLGVLPACEPPA